MIRKPKKRGAVVRRNRTKAGREEQILFIFAEASITIILPQEFHKKKNSDTITIFQNKQARHEHGKKTKAGQLLLAALPH